MGGYLDGSTDGYAGTIDVLEGRSGRRLRSESERARIAAESLVPGARVSDVARRHAVTRWQIYDWRKKLASGHLALTAETASEPMFAALVVAPPSAAVTGPRDGSVRSEAKSCLIELELDGVILPVRSDIDEAQLTRTIRAVRAASQ
ncbi:transposase [Paracoccus pantotrophus]|nr:transposase [Paracoccus pantotrophus]